MLLTIGLFAGSGINWCSVPIRFTGIVRVCRAFAKQQYGGQDGGQVLPASPSVRMTGVEYEDGWYGHRALEADSSAGGGLPTLGIVAGTVVPSGMPVDFSALE